MASVRLVQHRIRRREGFEVDKRFSKIYQGVRCDGLYQSGEQAPGQTGLATVRASDVSG